MSSEFNLKAFSIKILIGISIELQLIDWCVIIIDDDREKDFFDGRKCFFGKVALLGEFHEGGEF